eukprot:2994871-Ditylum_brightwellii.AAC.1
MLTSSLFMYPSFENAAVKSVVGMTRCVGKLPDSSTGLWSFTSNWGCGIALDLRLSWGKPYSIADMKFVLNQQKWSPPCGVSQRPSAVMAQLRQL